MKNQSVRAVVLVGLALMAGCSIINENIAMGVGQGAVDAARKVDSQDALKRIARYGKDNNARAFAISRLDDVDLLIRLVVSKEDVGVREAAFNRLVDLKKVDGLLAKGQCLLKNDDVEDDDDEDDSDENGNVAFARVVARGWTGKAGSVRAIPVEYRMKALEYLSERKDSSEIFTQVMLDDGAPIGLRVFSARFASGLEGPGDESRMKRLLEAAADESNASREDLAKVIKTYCQFNEHAVNAVSAVESSLRVKKFGIKCAIEGVLASRFSNRGRIVAEIMEQYLRESVHDQGSSEESAELAKYMIEQVNDPQVLGTFVTDSAVEFSNIFGQEKDIEKIVDYLIAAVDRIGDDSVLLNIVKGEKWKSDRILKLAPSVAVRVVERIRDTELKAKLDAYVAARSNPDIKNRGMALAKAYAIDPDFAYEIVLEWFSDANEQGWRRINAISHVASVTDLKTMKFIYAQSKAYDAKPIRNGNVLPGVRAGIISSLKAQVQSMTPEGVAELARMQIEHSQKLEEEGKTFVIAGRYVGMPLENCLALNHVNDIKVTPLDFDLDAQGEGFQVTSMSLDSANRYKATGLEKSEVVMSLPKKAKLAPFECKTTGDGLFSDVKMYFSSENQAKGVVVDFDDKSGDLIVGKVKGKDKE